ncbi:MAG: hypothetical protein WBA62_03115 [Xanthobacteraceae bacterium]
MHSTSGAWKEYNFQPRWRCCCELNCAFHILGFFAKQIDGRIDDRAAGWKWRSLWVTSGNRTPVHIQGMDAPHPGAPGTTQSSPLVVQFQMRPIR